MRRSFALRQGDRYPLGTEPVPDRGRPCGRPNHFPGTVYLSDPEGHSVASFPATGRLVSWSPDSNRVATWVDLGKTVGIYGLDGVRQALLTVPPGCGLPGDFDPVWSPDGTSLVIAGCVVPVDGRTPGRRPAVDPRSHFDSAYSRDGAPMAFIAYPESASLVIEKPTAPSFESWPAP